MYTGLNGSFDDYSEAQYELAAGALLVVYDADRQVTYGPSGWHRIEQPRSEEDVEDSIRQRASV